MIGSYRNLPRLGHFCTCSQQTSTCSGRVCERGDGGGELGEPPGVVIPFSQVRLARLCAGGGREGGRAAGKPRTAAASRSFDLWPACLPRSPAQVPSMRGGETRWCCLLRLSAFGKKHWHGVELLESCKCFSEENGSFNGTFCRVRFEEQTHLSVGAFLTLVMIACAQHLSCFIPLYTYVQS